MLPASLSARGSHAACPIAPSRSPLGHSQPSLRVASLLRPASAGISGHPSLAGVAELRQAPVAASSWSSSALSAFDIRAGSSAIRPAGLASLTASAASTSSTQPLGTGPCSSSSSSSSGSTASSSCGSLRAFSTSSSSSNVSGGSSSSGNGGVRNVPWGFGGGGRGGGEGRGLPPPVIISPTTCRVVVIGWMGSNRRYLNKYGSLWARSGEHEVIILRPSVAQTLVRWRGVVVAGRDIDKVAKLHRENPAMPTIYHVFSTGGFIHAGTMWRWMDEVEDVAQRRDLLEEVRGIILDSAPAQVHPDMASRAIVSAVTHTPAEELTHGMPGWQGALLGGTRSFLEAYLRTKGVQLRTEEVYDAWYNLAPVCPQLYLYSDADPLVPTADVERYMGIQEGRGVEVSGYKWSDSGHCEHFRRHPHEYAYQISAFLARALKDW